MPACTMSTRTMSASRDGAPAMVAPRVTTASWCDTRPCDAALARRLPPHVVGRRPASAAPWRRPIARRGGVPRLSRSCHSPLLAAPTGCARASLTGHAALLVMPGARRRDTGLRQRHPAVSLPGREGVPCPTRHPDHPSNPHRPRRPHRPLHPHRPRRPHRPHRPLHPHRPRRPSSPMTAAVRDPRRRTSLRSHRRRFRTGSSTAGRHSPSATTPGRRHPPHRGNRPAPRSG